MERLGLSDLERVELVGRGRRLLDQAWATAGGHAAWRQRKQAEARDLLALAQLAPHRLDVAHLDLDESLRAAVSLRVPVPCRPEGAGGTMRADGAFLGIRYPQEAMLRPLPGHAFVQVLRPTAVFHAQVPDHPAQPLCLGASLPAGIRLREIVLMTYGALSMQTLMLDENDPAGVMNPTAARWWLDNLDLVPLTRTPFLAEEG